MSLLFQLSIGVCPAVLLFVILTIISVSKKRPDRAINIAMLVVFSVTATALLVAGITTPESEEKQAQARSSGVNMQLSYAVAKEGDYSLALDVLYSGEGSSAHQAECAAWIHAAKGDALTAKALFVKANMLSPVENYSKVIAGCDAALADPEKQEALIKMACAHFDEVVEKQEVLTAGQVLVGSQQLYDRYLVSDQLDRAQVEQLLEDLEEACEEVSGLKQNETIRTCKIKLLALDNDYEAIAKSVSEESGFDEIAIAAELYINDLVESETFSGSYGKRYASAAKAVATQLKKVKGTLSRSELTEYKDVELLIEVLEMAKEEPAISHLYADLAMYAGNEQSPDRSKAYMQLARLSYADGNEEAAQQHISAALNTVGISDDENFSTPMINIVDSITDKDNIGKVKDIAQYAQDVTNNSSDYIVVKSISQYQVSTDDRPSRAVTSTQEEDSREEEKARNPFEVFFADAASQKRNAFSITSVDATDFETVRLVVNVDPSISVTEQELKDVISLKDCNVNIEDFTVEKVEYSGANILLCCDVSGSMGGKPIEDLRMAVQEFVETSTDIENISLVTFNNQVSGSLDFGTDKQTLISEAQSLSSGGGTNMYNAIQHSITKFSPADNELNFILLMSDGEDGYSPTADEIQNQISAPCRKDNIVMFSLGLGNSVNAEYMNELADATGGYFVYVDNSATLTDFYGKLRSQILNRYIITFKAKDTLRATRSVTVALKDTINDHLVSDTKEYRINGTDADVSQSGAEDSLSFEELVINGLDTRRLYQSGKPVTVQLQGAGFTEEMAFSATLDGKLDYTDIACTYVDQNTVQLRLPGGMACGVYDLVVNVDGKTGLFPKELTVSAKGEEKLTTFGGYVFTSDSRVETENGILLSGYVTMNGWLHFDGDVSITGDLTAHSVRVTDLSGSYIRYHSDSAVGLAKLFAKHNICVPLLPLGTFTLYNDTYEHGESENYRVETIPIPMVYVSNVATFKTPGLELYPNKIVLKSNGFTTKLPMQETLFKMSEVEDLFSFRADVSAQFTNKEIGVALEVTNQSEYADGNADKKMNFGNQKLTVNPLEFDVKLDTIKNEYSVEFGVKFSFIRDKNDKQTRGIGLKLEWKERENDKGLQLLCPTAVEFGADFPIKGQIGPVPVTYRDFKIGADDIDPNESIFKWKLVGGFDLETTKISTYLPGLAKYIDDPALFKLDDVKASLCLGDFYVGVETKAQLLEAITLGELSIEAGHLDFTCAMLDMYEQSATGLRARLKAGIIWKTDNVDIDVSGTGVLDLHSRFLGVELEGKCDLEVSWWIFEKSVYKEGRVVIGVMNNTRTTTFVIKARETNAKGTKDFYVYIDSSGIDCGTKKL